MRQARYRAGRLPDENLEPVNAMAQGSVPGVDDKAMKPIALKRDFFGGIIRKQSDGVIQEVGSVSRSKEREIWVSFHEGFSNAVRKPITLEELTKGF